MKGSAVPAVLFLLLLELQVSFTTGAITCTAGAFVDGDSDGAITCDFNEDVNSTQHNFNVVHYPFRQTESVISDSGNYILLCNWGQNKLECKVDDGYSFNYHVTSTLRVGVKSMSKRVEGMYVCQLVPDKGIPVTTCNLTVKENEVLPDATDITESPSAAEEKRSGVQLREAKTQVHQLLIVVVVLGIVVGILIVVIVLISCCRKTISSKLRTLSRLRTQPGQTGEINPEEGLKDADIPLMDISRDVTYPKNARHKPTQVYIDVIEKSIQAGNELGVRFSEKYTQLGDDSERTFLTGNLMKFTGDVVLTGSSKRFMNPTYSTLGTPVVQLPKKYDETEVGKKNSELCADVDVNNGEKYVLV